MRLIAPILAVACAVTLATSCNERLESQVTGPQPLAAGRQSTGIPAWDQTPFGVSGIRYDPGQEAAGEALIDALTADGATGGWVRITFYWNELQRSAAVWNPHGFVEPVTRFKKRGVKILGTIEGTAFWAAKSSRIDPRYPRVPPDLDDWRNWVQAVVDSFPQVDAWGIWNEPNDTNFFRVPDGQDATLEYARLVAVAAPIVHAANKPLVVGEIAWNPSTLGEGKTPRDLRDWVARMMRHITVTFGQTVEVLAVHHYGFPESNIRVPEVDVPLMYRENPDLPWSKWELWLTEFANPSGYKDEGTTADGDIQAQLATMFGYIAGPKKMNRQWKKAFYFNLADADGGRRNLVSNWEIARARNEPALLRYRSPFALYNRIIATGGRNVMGR